MQRGFLLVFILLLRQNFITASDAVSEQEAANRACNGGFIIDASSTSFGVISSPLVYLYGRSRQTYANNLNCEWVIAKPKKSVIEIWFAYADLYLNDGCNDPSGGDAVSLLEGNEVREVFCERRRPVSGRRYKFKTNSNVTVKFRSDVVEVARGFKLNWKKFDTCEPEGYACSKHADCWIKNPRRDISRCECKPGYFGDGLDCTEDVDLQACDVPGGYFVNVTTISSGVIASPRFPLKYRNSMNCMWTIVLPENHSIHLKVAHLEISQGYRWENRHGNSGFRCWHDHVTLYDGTKKVGVFCGGPWCGGIRCAAPFWNEYTFTSNNVKFVFESDKIKVHKGFNFTWTKVKVCEPEENQCSGDANCWIINDEVKCACHDGFVDVYGNGTTCEFSVEEHSCLGAYTFPGTSGVITSPKFPDNYPNYKHCKWLIPNPADKTVHLRMETFELEVQWEDETDCNSYHDNDYMEIFDGANRLGRYCDLQRPPTDVILSSGEDVMVVFHSDIHGENGRMRINWWLVDACDPQTFGCSNLSTCWIRDSGHVCVCNDGYTGDGIVCEVDTSGAGVTKMACSGGVVLTEPEGNVTSPEYPLLYPTNMNCNWTIVQPAGTLIHLNIVYFGLEEDNTCSYDSVELTDGENVVGKYCGNNIGLREFKSATNSVTIVFVSDSSVTANGFLISWSSV